MKRLLIDLLNIDTQNPPGNERILANYICDYLADAPVDAFMQEVAPGRGNAIARIKGREPGGALLLNGHLDTVPHGGSWDTPPGTAVERDGYLFARGASDMKSGLAVALYAFAEFARSGATPRHDILFCATCDEEAAGLGATAFAEAGYLNDVCAIVIGEPTGNGLGLASKGCLWIKANVTGRTSHGAYPMRGVNALDGAYAFARGVRALLPGGEHPLLGSATATVTGLRGGVKCNMVPDAAELWMDVRTLPDTDHEALISCVARLAREASENTPGLIVEATIENNRLPMETGADRPVCRELNTLIRAYTGRAACVVGSSFFSDASVFLRYGNFDVALFGPGESDVAHTPNERVSIARCEEALAVYRALLRGLV